MKTFDSLEAAVLNWAQDRGIVANGSPHVQLLKTMSELGELADAIIKKDQVAIVDGLGDVLVTLIIVAELTGTDLTFALREAYEEIKDRTGYLNAHGVFVKDTV